MLSWAKPKRVAGAQTGTLFYYFTSLDHSETSVLDSAGFEGHQLLNNWNKKTLKQHFNTRKFFPLAVEKVVEKLSAASIWVNSAVTTGQD